ncbi:unnamed protein product [Microthlaspi erraticum]|uniref:Pentacotripeptide-repeat region of PRORP domain-containing protein n=1 Tax=Microthlaspi erraticum TaxID=1685480 RepID=A0A6D2JC63_9BRAS|nr:unnamed protein product [Microthlaspi erraticum]
MMRGLVQRRLPETGTLRSNALFRVFSSLGDGKLSYRERLRSGIENTKPDDAVELFQSMLRSRPLPTLIDFSRLFSGIAKTKRVAEGYDQRESSPTFTFNALIDSFVKEGKLVEAKELYNEMIARGLEIFRKLSLRGLVADTVTYSTLIQGFLQSGKLNVAKELFQRWFLVVCPSAVTYGILLDGLCDNGELENALEIFEKMEKSKLDFDIGIYNIIIHGMCNGSKVDDAWDLFCSLPSKGVKPNVKTYTVMIAGLCKKGSLSEADLLFRKMGEDGIAP